jgi:hypothetical protein
MKSHRGSRPRRFPLLLPRKGELQNVRVKERDPGETGATVARVAEDNEVEDFPKTSTRNPARAVRRLRGARRANRSQPVDKRSKPHRAGASRM